MKTNFNFINLTLSKTFQMPIAALKNYDCYYDVIDNNKPAYLILCNSLGQDIEMWQETLPYFSEHYNIIRYDKRGHGKSSIKENDSLFLIKDLAEDVIELSSYLKDKLAIPLNNENTIFCGLSIGGQIGQYLAIHHPNNFKKIVLCCTSVKIGTLESWLERMLFAKEQGIKPLAQGTIERWLTKDFRNTHKNRTEKVYTTLINTNINGYLGACNAVARANFTTDLSKINIPILIISAKQDLVTTVADAEFMEKQIPNAVHKSIDALHLCCIEKPKEFVDYIIAFNN